MYLQKVKFALTTFLVFLVLFPIVTLTLSVVSLYHARIIFVSVIVVAILGGYSLVYRMEVW